MLHLGIRPLLRNSFTTRFLYTCIPSELYANKTLDVLLHGLVQDLQSLHLEGLEASQ